MSVLNVELLSLSALSRLARCSESYLTDSTVLHFIALQTKLHLNCPFFMISFVTHSKFPACKPLVSALD